MNKPLFPRVDHLPISPYCTTNKYSYFKRRRLHLINGGDRRMKCFRPENSRTFNFILFRSNATIRDQSTLWERPVRPTPNQLRQIDYQKNFLSPGMRSPTPMEMFLFRSQTVNAHKAPGEDHCLRVAVW